MATDQPITGMTGTPAGDPHSAKTKMGHKMALVHQRLSLPDNGSGGRVDSDGDFNPTGERDALASDSQPSRTKTGQQKTALLLSLLDNNSKPTDEERDTVVHQQSMDVDDYLPPPPLRTVRPKSFENGQEKFLGLRYEGAKKGRTKRTSTGESYKGKRGRQAGFKSANSNIEQNLVLLDSSGSRSHSKDDKDGDFEPPTPTRKRRRPAGSKCAKRKTGRKRLLVESSSSSSCEGMKDKDGDFEPEVATWNRAVEVQNQLPAEDPSFVKLMLHSHVVNGFWLGLPVSFARKHLPKKHVKIVLEDEDGQTWSTNYLADKMGLSGGWRGFAEQHGLKIGNTLVFQLVRPTTFKVYILGENKFTTTDGALGLLSLDPSMENTTSKKEEKESSDEGTKSKEEEPEVVARVSSKPSTDEEVAGGSGIRSPGSDTGGFVAVRRLANFKIVVGDGSVVGRRVLPDHQRQTYYELCKARKALLHRDLMKQISPMLAAGMIVETANIAEGIMASSPDSFEDLASWKKTLESFKPLGMDVTFMCKRIDDLLGFISATSSTMDEPEGYEELKLERARAAKKVTDLESRLSVLKDALREMDVEMEQMVEASARKKDQAVRELATAPW